MVKQLKRTKVSQLEICLDLQKWNYITDKKNVNRCLDIDGKN